MKAFKKSISVLLAVTVLLSILSCLSACFGESDIMDKRNYEGTEGLEFYPLPDGTYAVSVGTAKYLEEIVIPSEYKGNSVSAIADEAFSGAKNLKTITIPNSITSIGDSAFEGCTELTSITIPDNITNIGAKAFSECKSLVYNQYDNAYYLGNTHNPYLVLVKSTSKTIAAVNINESTKFIHSEAFAYCKELKSVTIPNSVTSIKDLAFRNCTNLTSITIPNALTSIGYGMLYGCSELESITIPESVTDIEGYAFGDCASLSILIIPINVKSIGEYTFTNSTSLTNIIFSGTMSQWTEISKDSLWNEYGYVTKIRCKDGDIKL